MTDIHLLQDREHIPMFHKCIDEPAWAHCRRLAKYWMTTRAVR
jgi:hypothetical protein